MISISLDDGVLRLFLNNKEIGSMYDGRSSIISRVEVDENCILVYIKNLLGGLYENDHKYIKQVMLDTVKELQSNEIDILLEPQIGDSEQMAKQLKV